MRTCLAVLEQHECKIKIWHDNEILPSDKWRQSISTNLADSHILLYLVSADSLASQNCNKELGDALDFKIRMIPIILEDCDWQKHPLGDFQVLPENGKPINEWQPQSKGWQKVVSGIREVVDTMQSQTSPLTSPDSLQQPPTLLLLVQQQVALIQQQGKFLIMIGQINRAIEAFNKTIELNPNDADSYNYRGVAYFFRKHYAHAIADFDKAIQINPDYDEAYNNRGVAYRGQGKYDHAIADYTEAIRIKLDYAMAYNNRGVAYRELGKYDRAKEDYNEAIRIKPDYAEAYYNRGNAYLDKGKYNRAITDYNEAIELNPNFILAYVNRGFVYLRKRIYDLAIEDCNKAIELDSNFAGTYCNRGIAWLHLQEWDKARSDLTTAKERGVDIIAAFHNDYESVADFEQRKDIKLPPDLAAMLTRMPVHPNVFISYSHDSPAHKQWVLELGVKLRHNGVDAVLDQWDLHPGDDRTQFMEAAIKNVDRVLVICTDSYVKKANDGEGGVGYERLIITEQLVRDLGTNKFIPIIRQASGEEKVPTFLGTRVYIDFTDDSQFDEKFTDLLHELHQVEQKPPLGKSPFSKTGSTSRQTIIEIAQSKEEQAKTNQNAEQGQQQERLKNAIDHLGHASDSVRMGGAHELFHLAKDNPELRPTVMDILCFHIRNTTKKEEYRKTQQSKPSEEMQSLLTLLFVQDHDVFRGLPINLQNSCLNGADLRGARLQKANLTKAYLQKTFLWDAKLQDANLFEAHLEDVNLTNAQLRFAFLHKTQLHGATLNSAKLHGASLYGAILYGAEMMGAQLQGADLSLAQLQGAILSVAQLQEATLIGTHLHGVRCQEFLYNEFEKIMRQSIGQQSDLSTVIFAGGLTNKELDSIVEDLSDEKARELRKKLEPHIGKPISNNLPENNHAITGAYTEEEAEKWIAEYEKAMSKEPTRNDVQ